MERPASTALSPQAVKELKQEQRRTDVLAPVILVGLAYLFVLALYPLLRGYTSPLDYAHLGQYFCCKGDFSSKGYDGQFFYYLAVDPLHANLHMDNAPFRYQRILFSVVIWALSLGGQTALVPWEMLVVNVLGTLAGTLGLAILLQRKGLSPWFSLAFGLFFGQFASITHDVPDGLAAALVVFGALAIDRGRWKETAIWLAAAGLVRETAMIFAAAFVIDALVIQRSWKRAAILLSSALPLALWLIALWLIFGKSGLFFSSVVSKTPKIPLAGLVGIAGASPRFFITLLVIALPAALALCGVGREIIVRTWRASPGLLFAIVITIGWLVVFLNAFTYGDLASSTRIVIGLPLGWLLYGAIRQSQLILWLATPWALGVALYTAAVIVPLQSIIP